MKIAVLSGIFPARSETFVVNQVTGLIDRGHDVEVFANARDDDAETCPEAASYRLRERTSYARLPPSPLARLLKIPRLLPDARVAPAVLLRTLNGFKHGRDAALLRLPYLAAPFVRKQPYDVIFCHFGWSGLVGSLLRDVGAVRGKLVTVFHGADISSYPRRYGWHVYQPLFASGDLFLPVSERWRGRLIEMGCDAQKIVVHRMGVDCERFSCAPRPPRAGLRIKIVSVARLVEKKGLAHGIRAVATLASSHGGVEYTIVGDGPLGGALRGLARELGLEDRVRFLGWKSPHEVREILVESDIFLAPSVSGANGDEEGVPVSAMEAMATGLPVVGTRHSGIPELVGDGVSGFLVPEGDADALADRLARLAANPELRGRMGREGRAFIEREHDIRRLNGDLESLFERVSSAGRSSSRV